MSDDIDAAVGEEVEGVQADQDRSLSEETVAATAADPAFERLLNFLKESRAFDFTGYKRPSLVRRVRFRMRELGVDTVEDYQDLLQLQPTEFTSLFNTILINVTSFFRDAEAWNYLAAQVLPDLVRNVDGAPIRVWSAGCAAGQEPYSIAMLLYELIGPAFRDRVKIYATDIDEEALDHARQAVYTEREMRGLPDDYRDRYFESSGGRWVLSPDLRRNVIFGRNDLTQDAPISRIDILLCRNTLMYFNAETQARVVSRLGFALRPKGVLFLGKAEMLLNHAAVFDPIDLKRRFFRKTKSESVEAALAPPWRIYGREASTLDGNQVRDELVLTNPVAQFAVGVDGRLLMVNHRAGAMLGISQRDVGRPFSELEVSYRPLELRSHLAGVAERKQAVSLREVEWRKSAGQPTYLDVELVPLVDGTGQLLGTSVTLTDVTRFRELQREIETANRQLETAYEELQSTNEELETTNEELQSTVEELETTNEELQSTNEELETMNEELQSANDELQITNDQLRDRTVAITELNDFMQSILGSLDAAVIVVDAELRVQVWTRQAEELWGLRQHETLGQTIAGLDSGLPMDDLIPWLTAVVGGDQTGVHGRRVQAVNRRGRTVELRVTVTRMVGESRTVSGALILFEESGKDVVDRIEANPGT
ncbi:CheR family methyltransferase [Microlunatus ginsengisoli]|uniref:protein-glutamate O-methyltransferase n=1 Tax=Microlunatus ginsengisoli TaxID=363863 RepID=A0ABP7A2S7_9ACTN